MPNSPVLDLQELASSSGSDVLEVLQKAKMISVKLGLNDITEWIDMEINGYNSDKRLIPEYRIVRCARVKANTTYHGIMPVHLSNINDDEIYRGLTTVHLSDAISVLTPMCEKSKSIYFTMPKTLENILHEILSEADGCQFLWEFSSLELRKIIATVKTKVLDWALELEQKGILGEGLLFSQKEKEAAKNMTVHNTNNFNGPVNNAGVIGSGNTDFSQSNVIKVGDFSSLEKELKSLGISGDEISELKLAIDETPRETILKDNFGDKIGSWIGKIVGKACSGSLKIAANTAQTVLSKAICAYYGIPS